MSTNSGAIKSSSDAVVSSDTPRNSDIAVSDGVKVVVGSDLLDLKTETLTTEPSPDNDGGGDVAVQDSVDEVRVPGDELGIVMENVEKVLDESSSDAIVSSVPPSNCAIASSKGVEVGGNLLESKTETLAMELSSDHDRGGDVTVQGSIDEVRVSGDEPVTEMKNDEKVLDESSSDAVISSVPPRNGDIATSNGVKIGANLLDLKTETLVIEPVSDHVAVQDSVDKVRVSGDKKNVLDESSSDIVVSSVPPSNNDIPANKVVEIVPSSDHEAGGDIVVDDSTDDARVSENERSTVTENIEKNPDENEEKEGEYKVTDLVWAKVRSYPWWPGQIFDPSASTEKAKKHSNKKGFLIAYFGDQSFAWNEASKIKPFRKNFSKMEKQSNSKPFYHAVDCALDEVSRRIEFGLTCSCLSKEVYSNIKSRVFVNDGIKKEFSRVDGGDNFSTVATFKSANIVRSVQDLAREHFDGFSKLEVMSVRTQLLAYNRWKGYNQLQAKNLLEKLEDNSEIPLMEEDKTKLTSVSEKISSKKRKINDCDSVPIKKEKRLKNVIPKEEKVVEDAKPKSTSVSEKISSEKRKKNDNDSVPNKKEKRLKDVETNESSGVSNRKNKNRKNGGKKEVEFNGVKKEIRDKINDKKYLLANVSAKGSLSSNGKNKMKKNSGKKAYMEENGDKEKSETNDNRSTPKPLFRIGDRICKIAKQISESPSSLTKEPEKLKTPKSNNVTEKSSKESENNENEQTDNSEPTASKTRITYKKRNKKDAKSVDKIQVEE